MKLARTWVLTLLVFGCPDRGDVREALEGTTAEELVPFASDGEFDAYVARIESARSSYWGWGLFGCGDAERAGPMAAQEPDESITNNQEQGVDEGDIVKALGDHFVILRRGRLFSVKQTETGLQAIHQTDAYAPGSTLGTWYDEMLVHDDRIVVVGYSYEVQATEIGLFRFGADGRIAHEATHFLRSNDYYSSRNYASRLAGSTLIFYMPYYLFAGDDDDDSLPSLQSWTRGDETSGWKPIVKKVDVFRPLQKTIWPTLHTVVTCDLAAPKFSCTGRAVLGPYARTFYVAPEAVYLWVSPGYQEWEDTDAREAYVYRLPLGGGQPTALRAHGQPIDQFSFKESGDGHLNVVLLAEGGGDAMWHPEIAQGDMALLRVPLADFDKKPRAAEQGRYRRLPKPGRDWAMQNRFAGSHVLWGAGGGWWESEGTDLRVYGTLVAGGEVYSIPLGHSVDRIEVLGQNAVVVGGAGGDLHFSTIQLGDAPAAVDVHVEPGAAQGETRSHGFFFKPDPAGGGVLGLPIRLDGAAWRHLLYGSARVKFLRVGPGLDLGDLGALEATPQARPDDACKYSCVDWYGNARPIFYRGRIFALLGYELVEGRLDAQTVAETGRITYLSGNTGS